MPASPVASPTTQPAFAHLQTFSRLRNATMADVDALSDLGRSVGEDGKRMGWDHLLATPECQVLLAVECDALVGAVVTRRIGALVMRLVWLGVARSARRRGVGHLLIEAAGERAGSDGVHILRMHEGLIGYDIHGCLTAAGFTHGARGYEKRV